MTVRTIANVPGEDPLTELHRAQQAERELRHAVYQVYFELGSMHSTDPKIVAALKLLDPWIPKAQDFGPGGL